MNLLGLDIGGGTSIFRHRSLVLFLVGRMASQLASTIQSVAIAYYLYELTDSAFALGFLGLVQFLPGLGLVFVTGLVADHVDRRSVLIACWVVDLACVLALLIMAFGGGVSATAIYIAMAIISAARAFEHPTQSALLPNLVTPAEFPAAVAWSSASRQYSAIIGPMVGGFGLVLGAAAVFTVAAALFAVAIACMTFVRAYTAQSLGRRVDWTSLFAGVKFIRNQPVVLGAISLDLFAVVLGGATALLPVIARDVLQEGPWALGLLRSGPSIGAFIIATVIALRPISRNAGAKLLWSFAGFGLSTIVFGLSTNLWLSMAALIVLGAADGISVFIRATLVQIATPDDMRGRVSAVNSVFISTSNSLGDFESGLVAAWLGAVPAIVLGGIGTLIVTGVWMKLFPELRRVDTLAQQIAVPKQPKTQGAA